MSLLKLSLNFYIDVAHFMPPFPEGHANRRVHGHTYKGVVTLKGQVDPETGMLMEYTELKSLVDQCVSKLDHRTLNDIPGLEIPSTEKIAEYIYKDLKSLGLKKLYSVQLSRASVDGLCVEYLAEENT